MPKHGPQQAQTGGKKTPARRSAHPPEISTAYLAELIQREAHFAIDEAGRFYVYENGIYQPQGDQAVRSLVKKVLRTIGRIGNWTSYRTKEVRQYLAVDAPSLWERPPLDEINVRNGRLHLVTGEFFPHSPTWFSPIQIPVTYVFRFRTSWTTEGGLLR
jgi:hypothetical protein